MSVEQVHAALLRQLESFCYLRDVNAVTAAKVMCKVAGIDEDVVRNVVDRCYR